MTALVIPQWCLASLIVAAFGLLLLVGLRRAGYRAAPASALIVLTLAQPALLNVRTSAGATLFAAAVTAVAAATVAFVHQQDARRIVLLGGSLAGAQLVHPIWGAAATVILPLALRRRLSASSTAGLTGLYVSILFVPLLTAATIFTLDAPVRSELWSIALFHLGAGTSVPSVLASILPGVPLLLALLIHASDEGVPQLAVIAVAILAVSAMLSLIGMTSPSLSCAAAFGALSLVLIGTRPARKAGWFLPFLLAGANSAAAWASMFLAQTHV